MVMGQGHGIRRLLYKVVSYFVICKQIGGAG
jgi:hypothetical protein